jgi:hypothetical protein
MPDISIDARFKLEEKHDDMTEDTRRRMQSMKSYRLGVITGSLTPVIYR